MATFEEWADWGAQFAEAAGILVILLGAVVAVPRVMLKKPRDVASWYRNYRRYLGRAILLGLELLVAADIIRTITSAPTISNAVALGVIVMIRTFLSFTLSLEVEGRWPWQRRPGAAEAEEAPGTTRPVPPRA